MIDSCHLGAAGNLLVSQGRVLCHVDPTGGYVLGREGNSQIGDRMQITEVQIYTQPDVFFLIS